MHFSLIFQSHESYDLTLSLTYEPCPIWRRGGVEVFNPHPDIPQYVSGDLYRVLELLGDSFASGLDEGKRSAILLIHPAGHGTRKDLAELKRDLELLAYAVRTVHFTQGETAMTKAQNDLSAKIQSHAHANERARSILIMRYVHDMSLDEVGKAFGITRERVRQIESRTVNALRRNPDFREKAINLLRR